MRSIYEIQAKRIELEAEADQYEDLYEENFVAIQTLRWILDMEPIEDERRREE